MDWHTTGITLLTALLASGSALAGSYLVIRSQVKMKAMEIEAQTRLKAKELIFSAYQKRFEIIKKESEDINKEVAEFISDLSISDKSMNNVLFIRLTSDFMAGLYNEEFNELLSELTKLGVEQKYKLKIDFIRQFLASDIDGIIAEAKTKPFNEREEMRALFAGMAKTSSLLAVLNGHLLQEKAEYLFNDHIN